VFVLGCGSDTKPPVDGGYANPLGAVGGLVLDGVTEMPLSGATVKVQSGGQTFTGMTGGDGTFAIPNVPSGSLNVIISNGGYETAIFTDALDGAVGNEPVTDPVRTIPPLALIKNDGTFSVKLVDQLGMPVPNVPVVARPQVRWLDYSNGSPVPRGSYEVNATSGVDGVATLPDLPEYTALGLLAPSFDSLPVDVPPVMVTSTPPYQFLGGTFPFAVGHLANSGSVVDAPVIRLAGPQTDLIVLDSNVDYLRGQSGALTHAFNAGVAGFIQPNGPITIVFNQAVNLGTLRAQLFNEDATLASAAILATGSANLVTLSPTSALSAGKRYNLALHVDAATLPGLSGTHELDVTAPLFVQPAAGSMPSIDVSSASTSPDKTTVTFSFSQPIGIGFGSSGSVSCVVYYEGINLDNGDPAAWPGEWNNGVGLTCPNPALDITAMRPQESLNMPVTGFSSKWQVIFDNTATTSSCKPPFTRGTGCAPPSSGTVMHFVFSKTTAAGTIKLPDGTPVSDSPTRVLTIP
jgi:hypothetical protein